MTVDSQWQESVRQSVITARQGGCGTAPEHSNQAGGQDGYIRFGVNDCLGKDNFELGSALTTCGPESVCGSCGSLRRLLPLCTSHAKITSTGADTNQPATWAFLAVRTRNSKAFLKLCPTVYNIAESEDCWVAVLGESGVWVLQRGKNLSRCCRMIV